MFSLTAAIGTNTNFGLVHNVTSIPCSTFYMQQFVTQALLNVDCQMNLSLSNAISLGGSRCLSGLNLV